MIPLRSDVDLQCDESDDCLSDVSSLHESGLKSYKNINISTNTPESSKPDIEEDDFVEQSERCTGCSLEFNSLSALQCHVISSSECKLSCTCEICGLILLTESKQRSHRIAHQSSPCNVHQCVTCGKIFYNKESLVIHRRRHREHVHGTPCKICGEQVTSQRAIDIHQKMHSTQTGRCEFCPLVLATCYDLLRHVKAAHPNETSLKCSLCGEWFVTKNALETHGKVHGTGHVRCKLCGKFFKYRSYLRVHEKIHSCERPFGCAYCNKRFRQASSLNYHQPRCSLRYQNETSQSFSESDVKSPKTESRTPQSSTLPSQESKCKIFTCPHCDLSFRWAHQMHRHVMFMHKQAPAEPELAESSLEANSLESIDLSEYILFLCPQCKCLVSDLETHTCTEDTQNGVNNFVIYPSEDVSVFTNESSFDISNYVWDQE